MCWIRSIIPRSAALVLAWLTLAGAGPTAAAPAVVTDQVSVRLLAEHEPVAPGQSIDLAFVFDIRPGWHTYWRNPGDSGEAPRVDWQLPEGVTVGPLQWPRPERIPVGPLVNHGYEDRATHLQTLTVPADWPDGTPLRLQARADWLVCADHCIPEHGDFMLTLATASAPGPIVAETADVFAAARAALPEGRIQGSIELAAQRLQLTLPAPQWSVPPAAVWFFAGEWGLVEHAAAQPWRLVDGQLRIELTPGPLATQTAPTGLLVITEAAGQVRSYEVSADWTPPPAQAPAWDLGLPMALLFALLGGLSLNLMPCVFPVLAMKALSLLGQGDLAAGERIRHALAYTGGVLVFFALVAALLLVLRAGGEAIGWGFQLQHPPFVALMAYLFFVLGLGLAGVATFGARLMGIGAARVGSGLRGAFGTGALAALVAAPCTAPFMGAALGYAVTLTWPLALSVMLTLGLGLALPFMLLALVPNLARRLPRPGPWMETFKQLLAFPLFGAAVWLVWVLSQQTAATGVAAVLSGMVLLAFALWLWERTRTAPGRWRPAGAALGVAAGGLALYLATLTAAQGPPVASGDGRTASAAGLAAPYSATRLAEARQAGQPVFVNMTAAWCITCLVNERVALNTPATAKIFSDLDLVYLKGDWTNRDPAITEYLAGYGRTGVPLYVFYPPAGEPRVLPQILTEGLVRDALVRPLPDTD